MAGLYVHIPFCKSRCVYCDFYSTLRLDLQHQYIERLCCELDCRKFYLSGRTLNTVYFGGGTPSILSIADYEIIIKKIKSIFTFAEDYEFTIEANPGDITFEKLQAWHDFGINRLSIGIQSFNDSMLRFLNRRHTSAQAVQAVWLARQAGFNNISIDLIYGIPNQTIDMLKNDIYAAIQLNIQHISTYCLTYEAGTPLYRLWQEKQICHADDDLLNDMYDLLISELSRHGFLHYEVSNFCQPDMHSRHNSAYWSGQPYLGVGAAAHSYNGKTRQYNEPDLLKYINNTQKPIIEQLSEVDLYNERIMLGLRTAGGVNISQLTDQERDYCMKSASRYIESGVLALNDGYLKIDGAGWHILDLITSELMKTE